MMVSRVYGGVAFLLMTQGTTCAYGVQKEQPRVLVDGMVAAVGSKIITRSDVQELRHQLKTPGMAEALFGEALPEGAGDEQLIQFLIEQRVVEVAIQEKGIDKSVAEEDVEKFMSRTGIPRNELIKMVEAEGLTFDTYHTQIRTRLEKERFYQQFIFPYIQVTEDQIEKTMQEKFPPKSVLSLSLLFLKPEEVKGWRGMSLEKRTQRFRARYEERTQISLAMADASPDVAQEMDGKAVGYVSNVVFLQGRPSVIKIEGSGALKPDAPEYQEKRNEIVRTLTLSARRRYMEQWVRQEKFHLKIERFSHLSPP